VGVAGGLAVFVTRPTTASPPASDTPTRSWTR
jgi:hypothetical protein